MYTVLRHKSERSLYGTLLKRLPDFYPMTVPWGVNRVVQCDAVRLSMVRESAVVILHGYPRIIDGVCSTISQLV